jgi:ferredoxin
MIAVAHCPCRVETQLLGRGCDYPLEVCLKFDEMADFLIEKELGRRVNKEEALEIIKQAKDDGLVHFVDNALGDIKHNCNCCGCCCWALAPIRQRKTPRDVIMATYFLRETDENDCVGCGDCIEVCPVDALTMGAEGFPIVDEDWCVGCGVCITKCPTGAAKLKKKSDQIPAPNFRQLHEKIRQERGVK